MVKFNQDSRAHFIVDMLLNQIWENEEFINIFCSGCPVCQSDWCPSDFDTFGLSCERGVQAQHIVNLLEDAAQDVVMELDSAGCWLD